MHTIVTLTLNPTIDIGTSVDHVVPEHKLRCAAPRREPGGGGINVARALQKLGGTSLALYLGGGPSGAILQELLDREGVTHTPTPIAGWTRESFTVLDQGTQLQYRFSVPGPTVSDAEWRRCLDTIAALDPPPDYLVASGRLPPGMPSDFYAHVARLCRTLGTRLIVDTSGNALRATLNERVFLIKPNLRELGLLVGHELADEAQQEAVARVLVADGMCEVVVLSLGAAGVLYMTADGFERVRAPIVPIKSKVGAGDSMVAGMVLSLARGMDVGRAVRFGVAAGAAAVMTPGTELCRRADAEHLYERIASAPAMTGRVTRYTCVAALAPSIEAALAANAYVREPPPQRQLGELSTILMTSGATAVLLTQRTESATATIEVWGEGQRGAEQLLESLPLTLARQSGRPD
jgi:6-phosphofructokinase 2